MESYNPEDLREALKVVSASIKNCEKIQPKFKEGTSQHSLLVNRIKALAISKALISHEKYAVDFTEEELLEALAPITSIIRKCEKAQLKATAGSTPTKRLHSLIRAMTISKDLIEDAIP